MANARELDQMERLLAQERARVGERDLTALPEYGGIRIDEIRASCGLAGALLARDEVVALVMRGVVTGPRALTDLIVVADYAQAAAFVAAAPLARGRRRYLGIDEIVEMHARALRRDPEARPGAWRQTTIPASADGIVAPPAWLVARDLGAFVEQFASGPPVAESTLVWVARAHARFSRIRPFTRGNGRVARLLANLLLRRLGLPPFLVSARERPRYERALARAHARDLVPLAVLMGRSVLANLRRLTLAANAREAFAPLGDLAAPYERQALYKAAQRGRLRAVRSGSTLLTSRAAIDEYRASRSAAGRKAPRGRA